MDTWDSYINAPIEIKVVYLCFVFSLLSALLFFSICALIGLFKREYRRKRFVESLTDDHDRVLISRYRSIDCSFSEIFKKDKE